MKAKTAKQIENCLVAIDMVHSLPGRAFVPNLADWTCGSAACLGGWVAQHPHFREQGVRAWKEVDPSVVTGEPILWKRGEAGFEVPEKLFGNFRLFYSRDSWRSTDDKRYSAKQVALNRLHETLDGLLDKS